MVEAHGADQRQVIGGDGRFEMALGVGGGVLKLREPVAEVNAVLEMREAALGGALITSRCLLRRRGGDLRREGDDGGARAERRHSNARRVRGALHWMVSRTTDGSRILLRFLCFACFVPPGAKKRAGLKMSGFGA